MGRPMTELWDVTCRMGSHSFTCHPTHVNAPPALTSASKLVLDLPSPDRWKAELIIIIVVIMTGLTWCKHSSASGLRYKVSVTHVASVRKSWKQIRLQRSTE